MAKYANTVADGLLKVKMFGETVFQASLLNGHWIFDKFILENISRFLFSAKNITSFGWFDFERKKKSHLKLSSFNLCEKQNNRKYFKR